MMEGDVGEKLWQGKAALVTGEWCHGGLTVGLVMEAGRHSGPREGCGNVGEESPSINSGNEGGEKLQQAKAGGWAGPAGVVTGGGAPQWP